MATTGRYSPNKVRARLLADTWVFPDSGMVLMRPTSITTTGGGSASLTANGSVTLTSVETLSLNGVFTSAYDNYMVLWRGTTDNQRNIMGRFRTGSTDSSTGYLEQRLNADNTSVAASRGNQTTQAWLHSDYTTQRSGFTAYLYGPNLAQPTAWRTVPASDYLSAYLRDIAGTHSASTAYESITLIASGGNMTGLVSVYGLGG